MPSHGSMNLMNNCLSPAESIRLQYRFAATAAELSRKTAFDKTEAMRLLQMHYLLTTKRGLVMDRWRFGEFADVFLDMHNADALEKIHLLRCRENHSHLTGREFVELMSLLLRSTLTDAMKFCFDVYTEIVRSPSYIKREDVLWVARRSSAKLGTLPNMDQYDRYFVEFVMERLDRDRDNRISFEDYRLAVSEDAVWLEFLGQVLPAENSKRTFSSLFTSRPYVNYIEKSILQLRRQNAGRKRSIVSALPADGGDSSLALNSDTTVGDYDPDACDNCAEVNDTKRPTSNEGKFLI